MAQKKTLPITGWPRPYVRSGVPGLSMERQEEMLTAIGIDFSGNGYGIFCDKLSRAKILKRAPLPERDSVVNPTHTGEVIYVASLRVLGWDHLDVAKAMAQAARRAASIHCADTGETYSPTTTAPDILNALIRAEEARRRTRLDPAREAARATKQRRIEKGLAIARQHWPRPPGEISVKEIAKLAGLSVRTLYHRLPPRTQAQEEAKHGKPHA